MKEEKILAIIDTNVIVSALLDHDRESNPSIILDDILSGIITPLYYIMMKSCPNIETFYRGVSFLS